MKQKLLSIGLGLAVTGGVVANGKKTDPDILARTGEVVGQKVKSVLPEFEKLSGPLAALRVGDTLTIEEQVRVRIRTDKQMTGADVIVTPGATTGEVKLRGAVLSRDQATRAVKLAEETIGVNQVVNELAVPE